MGLMWFDVWALQGGVRLLAVQLIPCITWPNISNY